MNSNPFKNPNIHIKEATKHNGCIPWYLKKLPHRHNLTHVYFSGSMVDGWDSFERCSTCHRYFFLSDWHFSTTEMYCRIQAMRRFQGVAPEDKTC